MRKSIAVIITVLLAVFILSANLSAEPPYANQYRHEIKTNNIWSWNFGFAYKYFYRYFNGEGNSDQNTTAMRTDPDQDQTRLQTRDQLRELADRLQRRDRIMLKDKLHDGSCQN